MTNRSNVYRLFSGPNTARVRVAVSSGSCSSRDGTGIGDRGSSSSLPTKISTVTSSASSFLAISSIRVRWFSSIHSLKNLCGVATKRIGPSRVTNRKGRSHVSNTCSLTSPRSWARTFSHAFAVTRRAPGEGGSRTGK